MNPSEPSFYIKKDKLEIDKYPQVYQKYLNKEKELVINFTKNSDKILDAGCGTGRIIPYIVKNVKQYVGVDINYEYLKLARKTSNNNPHVKILKLDIEKLSTKFKHNEFDKTISLWNTIGSLQNEKKAIEEISKVTKNKFFFTVVAKGTLEKRKTYYENLGIKYNIDEKNEFIKSKEWGIIRAFSEDDIKKLIANSSFKISKVLLIDNFAYAVYLKK